MLQMLCRNGGLVVFVARNYDDTDVGRFSCHCHVCAMLELNKEMK